MKTGERIKYLRQMKGWTTNKLAYNSGISQSHLKNVEDGKKDITVTTLSYICDALEISLSEFFQIKDDKLKHDPLLELIYKLNPKQRKYLEEFVKSMLEV